MPPPETHSNYGGSVAEKWINCDAYISLVKDAPPQPANINTVSGSAQHMLVEAVAKTGRSPEEWLGKPWMTEHPAFPGVYDEDNVARARVWFDVIVDLCDPVMYRILVEEKVVLTSISPELFGSCDLAAVNIPDKHLIILDYKDGGGKIVDVETTPQPRFYGIGIDDVLGLGVDLSWKVTYGIVQPKAPAPVTVIHTTGADIIEWRGIMRRAYHKSKNPDAKATAGAHCQWCRAATCNARAEEKRLSIRKEFAGPTPAKCLTPDQVSDILRVAPDVQAWLKDVEAHALAEALAGRPPPGYKVVNGKMGNRKWGDQDAAEEAILAKLGKDKAYTHKLLSPTQAEKAMGAGGYAAVAGFVVQEPGSPALAPEGSERTNYDKIARAKAAFTV